MGDRRRETGDRREKSGQRMSKKLPSPFSLSFLDDPVYVRGTGVGEEAGALAGD